MKKDNYNGYKLFLDDDDEWRRNHNRGEMILNMTSTLTKLGKTKEEVWKEVKTYLSFIPKEEHHLVYRAFSLSVHNQETKAIQ